MTKGTVHVMVGPSGSGKTTFIEKHFPKAIVVSADHYFEKIAFQQGMSYKEVRSEERLPYAHGECQRRFMDALKKGIPEIVVDNTNLRSRDRKFYMVAARSMGYKVEVIILVETPEVCFKRNRHGVPMEAIKKQCGRQKLAAGIYEYTDSTRWVRKLPNEGIPVDVLNAACHHGSVLRTYGL